jgi:uncharacterized protein (DUF433 family)
MCEPIRGRTTASAVPQPSPKNALNHAPVLVDRLPNPILVERNAKIRERYANGELRKVLAADYNLSLSTICDTCKGIKPKERRNAKIRRRWARGEPRKAIAADYKLTAKAIAHICKGVERTAEAEEREHRQQRNAEIRERYANGETQKAIGADFGLTVPAVSRICVGVQRKLSRIPAGTL